jgi:hypothetical protein
MEQSHNVKEATAHAQRRNIAVDLNFKPSQNAENLRRLSASYLTSVHTCRRQNPDSFGSRFSGSRLTTALLQLGKCSAVTSPSDSSSTQPGTWRQSKTFPPPPFSLYGDGWGRLLSMALFHSRSMSAPRPSMINAGYTDTTHGWSVIGAQTQWDVQSFGTSHKRTQRAEMADPTHWTRS